MKKILLLATALCAFAIPTMTLTSCATATPPEHRVVVYQSLKAVGHAAESAVALSANLYESRQITAAQARQVMDFYDKTFRPAYNLAKNAAGANVDSGASPDLVALAVQLSNLVASFVNHTTP